MRESSTYNAIWEEGKVKGLSQSREIGETNGLQNAVEYTAESLGAPSDYQRLHLEQISDRDRLKRIIQFASRATSWDQLLNIS